MLSLLTARLHGLRVVAFERLIYLNPSTGYDTHKKIGDNAGYSHHQTFHNCDLDKERKDKISKVVKTLMQLCHEVHNGA